MCVGVSQPVMVENFKQFGFIERGDGLARLVVVHQDEFQAWRVQDAALVADTQVMSAVIDYKEVIVFFAQDAVERIANVSVGRKARHAGIGDIAAGCGHDVGNALVAHIQARADNLLKEAKQAKAVNHAKGYAIFGDDRGNAPGAGCQ